jgi:serine/threonine protein kinase/Flp pilus assembly protein TadD
MPIESGAKLGRYEICRQLGAGGMGEVYLAQDTKLDRQVALKILPREFAEDKDRMSRFVREAKSASALNHPNIITIYEIGEIDSTHFIAAEYITGETLHSRLTQNPLDLKTALDLAIQIASALDAAHRVGIIHRDIKPENVMIRPDGLVKILDFGIAKLSEPPTVVGGLGVDEDAATAIKPQSTSPGMIIGTAHYMSPEQAKGKGVDARTDIFSFGIVCYEMLTSRRAFAGENALDAIGAILHKEPTPLKQILPSLPTEIERIVNKTLRKDRDERYQTARDLLTDLKDAKRELEFQDTLERTSAPHREEPKTEMMTAPATAEPQSATSSAEFITEEIKKHKLGFALGVLMLLALIGVGVWFFYLRSSTGSAPIDSIAVLPFQNRSADADTEYLSDGLAESLIYRLSQLPNLKVSPTSSVFRYKGKETDAIKIGSELGVNAVMTGRIAQRGENLTISVELVDVRNNKLLWGEQYERKISELLVTQREIAAEIANKLQLKLSGEGEQRLAKKYTDNNEAYQLYLKGRFYWNKRDGESFRKAIEQLKAAADKDPNFALAFVGLADCYALLPEYGNTPSSEALPQAKIYAERAHQIDDSLGEALISLANVNSLSWNWAEADNEFKRGIELNPNYATGYKWYGLQLGTLSRFDEALPKLKRAQELEPLSISISLNLADIYFMKGDLNAAVEQCQRTIELDPNWYYAHQYLGLGYLKQGRTAEALTEAEKSVELSKRHSIPLGVLGYIYAQTGKRNEAAAILEELRERFAKRQANGYDVARVYVGLGDKDQAFAWLEKDFQARSSLLPYWLNSPPLDSLRDDPRFKDLARRMGMPELK